MIKHFVTFYSPGTFVAEKTTKEIDSWDVEKAVEMSRSIRERYGTKPYGFVFSTRERKDDELDSKETKRSGTYYLGGTVLTLEEMKARKDPRDEVLISNMVSNGWGKVIFNNNSWAIAQPFYERDQVIEQ